MSELVPGLSHAATLPITEELTVPAVSPALTEFADMPPVFATAYMVGFIEATCIALLKPYLADGQHSVGTAIDVSHTAATPAGMAVTANVELIEAEGRRLRFRVSAQDDAGPIGEGTHDRYIIDVAKFMDRVEARRG
jgi:fluoroacetyl-CoA thioesterase